MGAAPETGEAITVNLLGVVAGEQGTAGGPATGGVVELREAQALLRQRVKIRRGDLAAVATDIRVAEVIREDEDDVGARRGGQSRQGGEQESQ